MNATPAGQKPFWPWAAFAARVIVGGLFVLTGVAKIMGLERFVEEVRKYDMLPLATTNAVAYVVPWLEVVAGGLLILCLWRREARGIIAAMLVVFTLAKAYAYARGLNIECGCGGGIGFLKYIFDLPQGILTNVVLLGLLWVDGFAQRQIEPLDERPGKGMFGIDRLSRHRVARFLTRPEKGLLGMDWKARPPRPHPNLGARVQDLVRLTLARMMHGKETTQHTRECQPHHFASLVRGGDRPPARPARTES